MVYEAHIRDCRPCRLREHCQWHGQAATHPRRVSLHLSPAGRRRGASPSFATGAGGPSAEPAWSWCAANEWRSRWRLAALPAHPPRLCPLSRPARAHWRLSWAQRLARTARARAAGLVTIHLFGGTFAFASFLGLAMAEGSNGLRVPAPRIGRLLRGLPHGCFAWLSAGARTGCLFRPCSR